MKTELSVAPESDLRPSVKKTLYGTFQLNGALAVHSWYPYITGYSAEFVLASLKKYGVQSGDTVLDFFGGVGTTSVVCKKVGINSISIDVNPFICFVATTKLNWSIDTVKARKVLRELYVKRRYFVNVHLSKKDPLNRYFSPTILKKLIHLRTLCAAVSDPDIRNLLQLALVKTLRPVSNCTNFAPYFEFREKPLRRAPVFETFHGNAESILSDLDHLKKTDAEAEVVCGNASTSMKIIPTNSIDFIITSPPYLNNWDYSWITKIESAFTKVDQQTFKPQLIKSCTDLLGKGVVETVLPASSVRNEIVALAAKLRKHRTSTKRQKYFDVLAVSYFNDMYGVMVEMARVMKPGSYSLIVLGDSGLYGVHIKTDELIGRIGELVGLKLVDIEVLRKRNASRHSIPLRESVVVLRK